MIEYLATAATIAKAAAPAMSASRIALRQLRLFGTFDPKWLDVQDGKDGLTATDISDVERFLEQRESRALLSLLATTLLTPDSDMRTTSLETIRDVFMNQTQRWKADHRSKWLEYRESIWITIREIYDAATPAGHVLGEAALEFSDFVSTPIGNTSKQTDGSARHVERLADLCSSIQRVTEALDAAASIKGAISESPAPPIITYTNTSKPATFGDLYVARTLLDTETFAEMRDLPLSTQGAPFRAVLQGAPGAGKSTFVRNLRHELSLDTDGQPALLLTVRNYFQTAHSQTILEHFHTNLRTSLNVEMEESSLRDALTLGLVVVIFDGMDEITDINLRVEMVERISSFTREYPAVSTLVTSRSVGYDRAPLPSKTFRSLVLDQYSKEQSREYVSRWFTFIDRPELIAEFERESETVMDLKSNPLLLSLLCVLYRERGSIPRRRRDIYADCADLLFHTWDSHRHIHQPEELHANGDRIMQEIARWVYTSTSAQSGLPESVIQKTIGIYLHDHVGVEEGEARRRAGEFLEFCATRAWLLGVTGTAHGERVFGFTHRTFFEYFTAEALSRRTSGPEEIAQVLLDANKRDVTSVLPELLLQSFDQKSERGAAVAFEHLCRLSEDELLIFRLMDGVPLTTRARAIGFSRIMDGWKSKRKISQPSFTALLTLNSDARKQFVSDYLSTDSSESVELFLGGWAALDLASGTARHDLIWGEIVAARSSGLHQSNSLWFTPSLRAWLWRNAYSLQMPIEKDSEFLVSSTSGKRAGLIWLGLEMINQSSEAIWTPEFRLLCLAVITRAKRGTYRVPSATAKNLADAVAARMELSPISDHIDELAGEDGKWAYLYLTAIVYEATQSDEEVIDQFWGALSPAAQAMWDARALSATADIPDTQNEGHSENVANTQLPIWLHKWTQGKRTFVRDPRDEMEWE